MSAEIKNTYCPLLKWVVGFLKGTFQHLEKTLQPYSILCQSEKVQTYCVCVTGGSAACPN